MPPHRVRPFNTRRPAVLAASPTPVVHVHVDAPTRLPKPPAHPLVGCALLGCMGFIVAPCGLFLMTLLLTVSGWVLTHHPAFTALWR